MGRPPIVKKFSMTADQHKQCKDLISFHYEIFNLAMNLLPNVHLRDVKKDFGYSTYIYKWKCEMTVRFSEVLDTWEDLDLMYVLQNEISSFFVKIRSIFQEYGIHSVGNDKEAKVFEFVNSVRRVFAHESGDMHHVEHHKRIVELVNELNYGTVSFEMCLALEMFPIFSPDMIFKLYQDCLDLVDANYQKYLEKIEKQKKGAAS